MKSGENYKAFGRRRFLLLLGGLAIAGAALQSCAKKARTLMLKLTGTNHILGHRLWAKDFPPPSSTIKTQYLIIGGGISGLSAARQLAKNGITDFLLLEMENHTGGNSSSGANRYSKFPLGAHYLPLPNLHDKILLEFLEEANIVVSYKNGIPQFDGNQLCFAPHERLFINHSWQEGLVPRYGNDRNTDAELDRFFVAMDAFRKDKDGSGKYYFDLPVSAASPDAKYHHLDSMTMYQWLQRERFMSDEVYHYIDYCCRDDFGLGISSISAWAGIHYFAARKNDYGRDAVLTWPEGNARLAFHLKKFSAQNTLCNHLAYEVSLTENGVEVFAFGAETKKSVRIMAGKAIVAAPQFVVTHLLPDRAFTKEFTYAPWLLATLTVTALPDNESFPLCWDNVIYGGKGLGYIYDQHQDVAQQHDKKVITYYYSFADADTKRSRKELYTRKPEYWKEMVLAELETAHPGIRDYVEEIRLHRLGHGMISPVAGFMFGDARQQAAMPLQGKIFFAHSDLSGISVFEEAFHQGIVAANQAML